LIKKNEIHFRLGIINKNQSKFGKALHYFKSILSNPPRPLPKTHILFQIGHVQELKKDLQGAMEAYESILNEDPKHAQVLQQLGWLYYSHDDPPLGLGNQDKAIEYLLRSIESDASVGQTWYYLGRCYMSQKKYKKAYDAYQQAVIRDVKNATFWCSIGVLYHQINQYTDALNSYTKSIRLNPSLSEVWFNLGTLYESVNQLRDSLEAYKRALELDQANEQLLEKIKSMQQAIDLQPIGEEAPKNDLPGPEVLQKNIQNDIDKDNKNNLTLAPINIQDTEENGVNNPMKEEKKSNN